VSDRDAPQARDWQAWHEDYERDSPLRRRLEIVQRHIGDFLDSFAGTPIHVVSMCAGEGRDLLGALAKQTRRDVRGRLVELDAVLAGRARARAADLGLTELEVAVGDAGRSAVYAGAVPADLVLMCGVLGNISDADVEATVRAAPMLAAPGATLIWTRHRRQPDLTPTIRAWFAQSGFQEMAFEPVPGSEASVGVARFIGQRQPLVHRQLFAFNREAL
jgi:hypothetical protein